MQSAKRRPMSPLVETSSDGSPSTAGCVLVAGVEISNKRLIGCAFGGGLGSDLDPRGRYATRWPEGW
jgi:hypothetical protein